MPRTPSFVTLRRQDRRSAALARRHGVLGLLMAAEGLPDVIEPACRPDRPHRTERAALDVLWRTLYRGSSRGTPNWNPGTAHMRQSEDVRRWGRRASQHDVAALLISARRVAADEFGAARAGRRTPAIGATSAVPQL